LSEVLLWKIVKRYTCSSRGSCSLDRKIWEENTTPCFPLF